eukprot:scaffold633_cov321-Pavlova_lutheri.AAC.46
MVPGLVPLVELQYVLVSSKEMKGAHFLQHPVFLALFHALQREVFDGVLLPAFVHHLHHGIASAKSVVGSSRVAFPPRPVPHRVLPTSDLLVHVVILHVHQSRSGGRERHVCALARKRTV